MVGSLYGSVKGLKLSPSPIFKIRLNSMLNNGAKYSSYVYGLYTDSIVICADIFEAYNKTVTSIKIIRIFIINFQLLSYSIFVV